MQNLSKAFIITNVKKEPILKKVLYSISAAFLIFVLNGCTGEKPDREVLATIDNYSLYKEDFLSEAQSYPPSHRERLTKEDILDDLIQKKLLLLEAQRQGLDKDPAFMRMVERFWEQSLLRSLLEKRSKEILSSMSQLTEEERDKRASQMMQQWVDSLRKGADIRIDRELLENIELK